MTNNNRGPNPQFVPVSVAQGIETKVDPNLVQSPKGLVADNVRLTTLGAVRKRYGNTALPGIVPSASVTVGSTQKQLIAISNNALSAFDTNTQAWGSPVTGYAGVRSYATNVKPLASHNSVGVYNASVAAIGNVGVYCVDDSPIQQPYSLVLRCFDTVTGQLFWSTTVNGAIRATGSAGYVKANHGAVTPTGDTTPFVGINNSRVISYGNQFVITFQETRTASSGTFNQYLRCFTFNPSPTAVPNFTTGSNCTQIDNYAFPTYWGNTNNWQNDPAISYSTASNATDFMLALSGFSGSDSTSQIAAPQTNVMPITQTSTFATPTITTSSGGFVQLSLATGLQLALIGLENGYFAVQTPTGSLSGFSSLITWPTTFQEPLFDVCVTGSGSAYSYTATDGYNVFTGSGNGLSGPVTQVATKVAPAMVSVAPNTTFGTNVLASQITMIGSDPCAWISMGNYPSDFPGYISFPSLLFVDLVTNEVLARAFYLQTLIAGGVRPAPVVTINNAPSTVLYQQAQDSSDNLEFAKLVSLVAQQPQILRTPDGALITGANTKYYDNALARSAGWLMIPQLDFGTPITGTTGGNLTPLATYSYILVLADFDAAGNAIYSSPSVAYNVTLSGSQNAVKLNMSQVWPINSPSASGSILYIYRNSVADPLSYNLATTFYLRYMPTVTSWTDTSHDNDFASTAQLYAQPDGGELPNDPAPPSTCGVATKTRVFLASSERTSALYFSKPFFYGRAPEFNYGNVLDIEPASGGIMGLGALDDNVVIFKSSYIYVLTGQGPDATGSGVFNAITNISTDRGLLDRNSIALSNDGLYFRSQRGIELLDRSFNLNYIGSPVETLLKGNTVVSALSVPGQSQVRFALSNGSMLVYDYTAQGWTTYTYKLSSVSGSPVTNSQTLFNGVAYLGVNGSSGGLVYQESAAFLDETNLFPCTIQTSHVPLAGQLGWGRARRANILGVVQSLPARVSVQFVYDYGQVSSPPVSLDLTATGPFSMRVRTPRQVATAVGVVVQLVTTSGTGEGCYLTGITMETLQKSGALRAPDSQSI